MAKQTSLSSFFKKNDPPTLSNVVCDKEVPQVSHKHKLVSLASDDSGPGPSKISSSSKQSESRIDYEKNVRQRLFNAKWLEEYQWLEYDVEKNLMFCKICKLYPSFSNKASVFVTGSNRFRKDPIQVHHTTPSHIAAMAKHETLTKDKVVGPMDKKILDMNEKTISKLKKLFTSAYFLAKHFKPFTDFEWVVQLQIKNELDVGTNYINDKGMAMFVQSIAKVLRIELASELKKCRFMSVMADGSEDHGCIEQEVVYMRVVKDGVAVSKLIDFVAVETADSKGVLSGIEKALHGANISLTSTSIPVIVCANFDGAAVNMGSKGGTAVLMKQKLPFLLAIHCVAHKLELVITDMLKDKQVPYLLKFDETVKRIFTFYSYSPKRRRELKTAAHLFEEVSRTYGDISTIRWLVSRHRALEAIQVNMKATFMHLENCTHGKGNKSEEAIKANIILREFKTSKFVKFLFFMLDFLAILSYVSESFQHEAVTLHSIVEVLQEADMKLEMLKTIPGKNMQYFITNYNPDNGIFDSVQLLSNKVSQDYNESQFCDIIDATSGYLSKRFKNLKEPPLSLFNVFNFLTWPESDDNLRLFGNSEINELSKHFESVLTDFEVKAIPDEWLRLKIKLKKLQHRSMNTVYRDLLSCRPADISSILALVEIMYALSPSTAICERGFSAMNLVKSVYRTKMSQETLSDLMVIKINGPKPEEFDATASVMHWMTAGVGTRHIRGHKLHKPKICDDFSNEPGSSQNN